MEPSQKPKAIKRVVTIYGVAAFLIILAFLLTLQPPGGIVLAAGKRAMVADRFAQLQAGVQGYYTEYGVYPVATDGATLARILTGATKDGNERQIAFVAFKPRDTNPEGDLLDPWGTPYQVSVTANGKLHARSAGPDKIFGAGDDISGDSNLSAKK